MRRALVPLAVAGSLFLPSQQSVADELLSADRAFAAASAGTTLIPGLSAMFSDTVTMTNASREWVVGAAKAVETLRSNPANANSTSNWTPIRVGISADGLHGFTFGYITTRRADGTVVPGKYMSYWVKEASGWRVVVYKRAGQPAGAFSKEMMPPSLPARMVAPTTDAKVIAGLAASVAQAEQAFSDEASVIGLGPAFAKYGRADAVNMGGGAAYTVGAAEIAKGVAGPTPSASSALTWKSDRVLVASSGDLGISIGVIRNKEKPDGPGSPFFTIWYRASPSDPWRYIAE